jgi:hypothetical protein
MDEFVDIKYLADSMINYLHIAVFNNITPSCRAIRPLMLMPKGTIYFSEIYSDEANLYTNSIKSPIGKKASNSVHFPVSVIQEAPRDSGPPVQMSCFASMVWTRGSMTSPSAGSFARREAVCKQSVRATKHF